MTLKIVYSLISIIVLFSCSPMVNSQLHGKYKLSKKDSQTTITIMDNGNFLFEQKNLDVSRNCMGKWKSISKDKIVLECDDQSKDVEKVLSSGYMDPLNEEVILISKRKIKMGNLVLKRVDKE